MSNQSTNGVDPGITPHNIPKLSVKELVNDMLLKSSILAFVDFKDIMVANPNFTYYSIVSKLVRAALQKYEAKIPFYKRSRIYIQPGTRDYTFIDNFSAFLDCKIQERYVTLIPKVSPYSADHSLLHARRSWVYERPSLKNMYIDGSIDVEYMTYYPVVIKEDKESDDFTDDSYIYYMSLYEGPSKDLIFKRQFYYEVITYLKGVKNNLRYPDMPIELLQGVDEEYSILQSELQESYRKHSTYGKLYR